MYKHLNLRFVFHGRLLYIQFSEQLNIGMVINATEQLNNEREGNVAHRNIPHVGLIKRNWKDVLIFIALNQIRVLRMKNEALNARRIRAG